MFILSIVYLCEQGSVLRKKGLRIQVEKNKQLLMDIPVGSLEKILIFGNIQLTTPVINLILDNNIDVAFLSMGGRLRGKLNSNLSKNIFIRLAQYDRWRDPAFKLQICRKIVEAKLKNMCFVLRKYQYNYPENNFTDKIQLILRGADSLNHKTCPNELMGVEGRCSGAYFSSFSNMFRRELQFSSRQKRPTNDPVNSLLNLGYVMITNEISSVLEALNLDPYLGFLHGVKYGRKSLALDMVEEFRQPLIDLLTLRLANLQIFSHTDFELLPGEGVRLTQESLKKYLEHYERKITENVDSNSEAKQSWRNLFLQQATRLKESLLNGEEYLPFIAK